MAFADLASNQMVSEADAATGGFPLQSGQSHGSSNQCMSKDAANVKYVLNQTPLGPYAGNQLIPKSVWQSGVATSTVANTYFVNTGANQYNITFQLDLETDLVPTAHAGNYIVFQSIDIGNPFNNFTYLGGQILQFKSTYPFNASQPATLTDAFISVQFNGGAIIKEYTLINDLAFTTGQISAGTVLISNYTIT